MHELAHVLLGHQPGTMFYVGVEDIALRSYSKDDEDEAKWLSGTLLLPRLALTHVRRGELDDAHIQEAYGVSQDLLRYRMDVTGVNSQFGRGRRRSA